MSPYTLRLLVGYSLLMGLALISHSMPFTAVTLTASPAAQTLANRPVTLTAIPTGGVNVEYCFLKSFGGVTTTLQPYTLGAHIFHITPTELGQYQFVVWARETGRTKKVEAACRCEVVKAICRQNPTDGAAMVWVPGDTFTMGSPYGQSWEGPATQQVTLTGYWIYQYEVTVAQYRAFCTATGRALPIYHPYYSWAGDEGVGIWSDPARQQHPMVNVTWYDTKAYADWAGVTLPTEAQWEYAARGTAGSNYAWGGIATAADLYNGWDQTKCANYPNSYEVKKGNWPVGSFPAGASWCGAHDLTGNVWEWCADWYGEYSSKPVTDPTGPATGNYRVLRGGSWYGDVNCRAAFRYLRTPGDNWNAIGFRCVSSLPPN